MRQNWQGCGRSILSAEVAFMVEISAPFVSGELLANTLGQPLPERELSKVRQHIKLLEPPALKQFWQSGSAEPGIYIIITGKCRLTDSSNNSPASLQAGESFGELTLFPEDSFAPHSVRAAKDAPVLGFLPSDRLQELWRKYPQIREYLHRQAALRDAQLRAEGVPVRKPVEKPGFSKKSDFSEPAEPKHQKKISKAYFPSPTLQISHFWQHSFRRYPFFAQQSASDCGAACLVMAGRYWGRRFSVNRLRDLANVDRNGASLRGLSAAAESIGFSARPVKASLDQLAKQSLPAIAHWEGKHYIVVCEIISSPVAPFLYR
jgi:ATP-binding cassette subfamily B protein